MEPLGLVTTIGLAAGRLLMTGVLWLPKWAVLPVSAMATAVEGLRRVGLPKERDNKQEEEEEELMVSLLEVNV